MSWAAKDVALSAQLSVAEKKGWRRTLAIIVTHSGDAPFLILLLAGLLVFGSPEWQLRALTLGLVDVISLIVSQIMKYAVRRPRPEGEWGKIYRKTDPHSFPSGHSARGGSIGLAALLISPIFFGLPMLIWGAAIAYSRVAMGVHYLADVIGGYLLGLILGFCVALVLVL